MKKITKLVAITFFASMSFALSAQSVSITNTFGGDEDNLSGNDFLIFDKDGDKEDTHISDRLQLDVKSEHLDSRVRFNFDASGNKSGKGTNVQTQGYVNLRPVQPLNIIVGNKFFAKWAMAPSYLCAVDDNLVGGKLTGDNGAAVVFDMKGFQAAAGVGYESKLDANFGLAYTLEDVFSVGATLQNATENARTVSAYAGLLAVENLTFNAGYGYHLTENNDYLNDNDEESTLAFEHAAILTVGYEFPDLGLYLAADGIFSLTDKVYDSISDSTAELLDEDENKVFPIFAALYASYGINDAWTIACRGKALFLGKNYIASVYPHFEFETTVGKFTSGVRFLFDSEADGFNGFSIPFCWIYKFKVL